MYISFFFFFFSVVIHGVAGFTLAVTELVRNHLCLQDPYTGGLGFEASTSAPCCLEGIEPTLSAW
jgi:hypothetical protein